MLPWNYFNTRYYLDDPNILSLEVNQIEGAVIDRTDSRIIECPRRKLFGIVDHNQKNLDVVMLIFKDDIAAFRECDNIALILTYCLSADGKMRSTDEQLALYSKVCDCYWQKKMTPVIKPHPRDLTDYSSLNVDVVNKNFPSELLYYIDQNKIVKNVSIYSTSTSLFPKEKVDYYETPKSFIKAYETQLG